MFIAALLTGQDGEVPARSIEQIGEEPDEGIVRCAVNRRGRNIKCRVSIGPFKAANGARQGAVIMMEEMGM